MLTQAQSPEQFHGLQDTIAPSQHDDIILPVQEYPF